MYCVLNFFRVFFFERLGGRGLCLGGGAWGSMLRALLHEMLLTMGYLAIRNHAIQEMFRWGHRVPPSLEREGGGAEGKKK